MVLLKNVINESMEIRIKIDFELFFEIGGIETTRTGEK
jgi:hypothetical protein